MFDKKAVIIGAGPAGLTAAYELLKKTDIKPIIYEMSGDIGGISKTVDYKGNKIDIGGHRFMSESPEIMAWWQEILPMQRHPSKDDITLKKKLPEFLHAVQGEQGKDNIDADSPDPEKSDRVMLIRNRISRIFFLRKFFAYPISLDFDTLSKLGLRQVVKIIVTYTSIRLNPVKGEKNLEDFLINRFGKELYVTFFKDYTEKVWGVASKEIKPEWGSQRIRGVSVKRSIVNALKKAVKRLSFSRENPAWSEDTNFMYPKLGPGQMWEEVARLIEEKGGKIFLNHRVVGIKHHLDKISAITVEAGGAGCTQTVHGDYFFSTMPVKELVSGFDETFVPEDVRRVASGLMYRDFITVSVLLSELKIKNDTNIKTINNIVPDNWIYIQERDVKIGRLQIFNNWSPYMVKDENTVWVGLEYFCSEGDSLWIKADAEMADFAIDELAIIGIIDKNKVLDSTVVRMPKAYPAYFGTYDNFSVVRNFTDAIENLFLVGRNGMHQYNNTDHSMLTAIVAVENIIKGVKTKDNIWDVKAVLTERVS